MKTKFTCGLLTVTLIGFANAVSLRNDGIQFAEVAAQQNGGDPNVIEGTLGDLIVGGGKEKGVDLKKAKVSNQTALLCPSCDCVPNICDVDDCLEDGCTLVGVGTYDDWECDDETETCVQKKYKDKSCSEGTTQESLPPVTKVSECHGETESEEKKKKKTCACGTIKKTFDISGCITVEENIEKDICDGSKEKSDGKFLEKTECRECYLNGNCDLECD